MILFKPNGGLNLAMDASELPETSDGKNSSSEVMTRFKNLRVDLKGVTKLRDGSSKVNSTAFAGTTELVTNGGFTSDISNWSDLSTGGASLSWVAGVMRFTAVTGNAIAQQSLSISVQSVEHTLTFDLTITGTNTIDVTVGTTSGGSELYGPVNYASTGSYTVTFTPTAATVYLRFTHRTYPTDVDLDNVSVTRSVEPVNLIMEQGGVRYEFAGTKIFRNEVSIETGLTDAQWSAIKYNSYNDTVQSVFALNGTNTKRISGSSVYNWGATAPATPTTAVGASTGLTGVYSAKVTYCRKVSSTVVYETNPSSAGTNRTLSNGSLSVTWVASTDSQITHVRVYRTLSGGSEYYHDQDIAIGTLTIDTNTADASLGDKVEIDHTTVPLGTVVIGPAYDGTCFILKDNLLYYCKPKQPEYWPATYYIEVSALQNPLVTGVFHNGQLYCLSGDDIFYIQGTGHGTFFPIKMKALTGAQGQFGALSVPGKGIFHTGPDGIYLFSGEDKKVSEEGFEPIFRGEETNGVPGVLNMTTAWLYQFSNKLYFGYTSTGYTYPTNIIVFNLDNGRAVYYQYNDGSVVAVRCLTTDYENDRILAGDTAGFIRVLENKSVTTDSDTAISWEAQSKDFTLQTRAHFPRWHKYDIDASSATSCTGALYLDGTLHQSHTLTGNRDTTLRLITTGNGKRAATRVSGSGPISIYAVEME
jgi:hypothetical protein